MCFTVQLSMFVYQVSAKQIYKRRSRERMNRRFMSFTYLVLSQTALVFYHVVFCLSRTFLTFFKFFLDFFYSRSNFDILSLLQLHVKDFFQLFSKLFSVLNDFPDATLTSYHCFLCLSTVFSFFLVFLSHLDYSSDNHYPMPYSFW